MSRSLDEWIGKTDDTPIPPRVKLRVFERAGGVCHISGRKIRAGEAWQCDHVLALINGGENRESNLAPALVEPHKIKTAADVALKSKTARIKAKHLGTWPPPARKIQSRGFPKTRGSDDAPMRQDGSSQPPLTHAKPTALDTLK